MILFYLAKVLSLPIVLMIVPVPRVGLAHHTENETRLECLSADSVVLCVIKCWMFVSEWLPGDSWGGSEEHHRRYFPAGDLFLVAVVAVVGIVAGIVADAANACCCPGTVLSNASIVGLTSRCEGMRVLIREFSTTRVCVVCVQNGD